MAFFLGEGGGVASEAGKFGALYSGVAENSGEGGLIERKNLFGREAEDIGPWQKFGYFGYGGCGVVGTCFLTFIAAVYMITIGDDSGEVAPIFYREI